MCRQEYPSGASHRSPESRDGGIDLKAVKAGDVEGALTLLIQCKNYVHPTGVDVIRELVGVLPPEMPAVRGVVAYPGGFSAEARVFGHKRRILLWDRYENSRLSAVERPAVESDGK